MYNLINEFCLYLSLIEKMIDMLFCMLLDREVNIFDFKIKDIVVE